MNYCRQLVLVTLSVGLLMACTHTGPIADETLKSNAPHDGHSDKHMPTAAAHAGLSPDDVSEEMIWGNDTTVRQIKHLYIASQPDQEALQTARQKGVATIIDLRAPGETDWNERQAVEALGMRYLNLPIPKQGDSLDTDTLQQIEMAVAELHGEPVLLHCSSGNRAAAWLATHLADNHELPVDESLAIAAKAGLTHEGTLERTTNYLNR